MFSQRPSSNHHQSICHCGRCLYAISRRPCSKKKSWNILFSVAFRQFDRRHGIQSSPSSPCTSFIDPRALYRYCKRSLSIHHCRPDSSTRRRDHSLRYTHLPGFGRHRCSDRHQHSISRKRFCNHHRRTCADFRRLHLHSRCLKRLHHQWSNTHERWRHHYCGHTNILR